MSIRHTGNILGTPAFPPPEVLQHAPPDPRSDLYALGCVAYWLLAGRRVFDHDQARTWWGAHLPAADGDDCRTQPSPALR